MSRRDDVKPRSLVPFFCGAILVACSNGFGQESVKEIAVPASQAHRIAEKMAFSHRGEMLALSRYDGTVDLLDVATGKVDVLPLPDGARPSSVTVAFARSGRSLAMGRAGRGVTIWDVATKGPGVTMAVDPGTYIRSLAFLDGDRTLRATTARRTGDDVRSPCDYAAVRWDVATGERRASEDLGRHPVAFALSPDGRYGVVFRNNFGDMSLRDLKAGAEVLDLSPWDKRVIFTPDGSALVVCDGGSISFRELPSGRERRRLAVDPPIGPPGTGSMWLAISADARLLAVGSYPEQREAALVSLATGKVLAVVECGPALSLCQTVQPSPDGHTLATATAGGNANDQPTQPDLKLWKIPADW